MFVMKKKKKTPFYEPYGVPSTHLSVLHILTHSNLTTISVWKMKKLIESLSNLPMFSYNLSKCSKASRVVSKSVFVSYTVCVCLCVCVFTYVSTPAQKLAHGKSGSRGQGRFLYRMKEKRRKRRVRERGGNNVV